MNLKTNGWRIYAIIRECDGKKKAEEYKQKCFKRYKKYGILSQNENNGYNFVKAFGDYDSYTLKCFIPSFFSDSEKEEIYDQIKIPFFYSPYDCTGQKFTAGVDFYRVHNGTWIYHRIGVDI